MNAEEIKQLENELWGAADDLRANSKLTAAEYKDPVLGLILLRYAQNRYDEAKIAIEASIPESPRGRTRVLTKDDFLGAGAMMLPENAQYEFLANLPESEDVNEAVIPYYLDKGDAALSRCIPLALWTRFQARHFMRVFTTPITTFGRCITI